ncbi:universal stress protein UspA [Natrinema saccharevitans]|uniref:Universal stress protein UspA n=1 Tax=Natrinema saccharevitans TaxID=301967 RepID=A0A1S8AWA8_9EURY|nr:universal stress protein [Natrinema saccharevitans]OLZ40634.1 universal stress protein UspA [Natrinema saccharevitans]
MKATCVEPTPAARLLVPFDDFEPARDALEYAFDLFPDGDVTALIVVDTTSLPFGPNTADDESSDESRELLSEAAALLETAESIAADRGTEIESRTRLRTPAREILKYAEGASIDHIVMGSRERSGVARILLGSVAEVVVRYSPVPVTVVR